MVFYQKTSSKRKAPTFVFLLLFWLQFFVFNAIYFQQVAISQTKNSVASTQRQEAITNLKPDSKFLSSKKYKRMAENAHAKFDMELLRHDFIHKGHISFKPDFPDGVIEGAAALTQECLDKCPGGSNMPRECKNLHQERFIDVASVRDVALNYDILSVLAVLHGHDPYPFQTLNYPKSSLARTHSDYVHFAAHPMALMSAAWVALMDIDPDAGPVFYYEGSHKLPSYNMQDFGLDDRSKDVLNYARYQDIMTATMRRSGFVYKEAVIKKGWVFIWSANLVHGGPRMRNPDLKRLSQVTHYFYRNSDYNWAPVASETNENAITFYNESAIDYKFSEEGTNAERKAISKFIVGPCDLMTKTNPHVPSPCNNKNTLPQVLSQLLTHVGEQGYDVVM